MTLTRLQHIGVAVSSYEQNVEALSRKGLPVRDFRNDQGKGFQHDARALLGNDCWLHVVYNWNPESRVNRFLTSRGPGLEHIALQSDDIAADVGRLRELGVPIFEDHIFDANDGFEAFVYPDDAIGFTVELIQPHAHSWGYPEDARGKPVSDALGRVRLAEVVARVPDVAAAASRFQTLFDLEAAEDGRIQLGNTVLSLRENDAAPGLATMRIESEHAPPEAAAPAGSALEFPLEIHPAASVPG